VPPFPCIHQTIYKCFLGTCLATSGGLTEEDKASLWELSGMLQLQEADCYSVYVAAVQPIVAQKLDAMVSTYIQHIV
jgi:hypothetical protein